MKPDAAPSPGTELEDCRQMLRAVLYDLEDMASGENPHAIAEIASAVRLFLESAAR